MAAFGAHAAGGPGAGSLNVNERRRAYARQSTHGPARDTTWGSPSRQPSSSGLPPATTGCSLPS
eukprot:1276617-Pyramimonas_sp.AAC.1